MPVLALLLLFIAQPVTESPSELTLMMHERFAYASMARTALIHGYLGRALRHADQLSDALVEGDPEPLRELARKLKDAETVSGASAGIASVAEGCGTCHEQNKVKVVFLGHESAPWGQNLTARMGRHIWAADRMWQGLIAHDETSWVRGAGVLDQDPFLMPDEELRIPQAKLDVLTSIAAEAQAERSWPKRAEIYGRFLAQCADCHQTYAR